MMTIICIWTCIQFNETIKETLKFIIFWLSFDILYMLIAINIVEFINK